MTIGVIFKIAAVGILVSILSQVLKHSGRDLVSALQIHQFRNHRLYG